MGLYTCTATNLAGAITTNITLSVLDKPKFVKPMIDKKVGCIIFIHSFNLFLFVFYSCRVHSFFHSFFHSSFHIFIHSFIYTFIYICIHLLIYSLIQLFFLHLVFKHSFIQSSNQSFILLFILTSFLFCRWWRLFLFFLAFM